MCEPPSTSPHTIRYNERVIQLQYKLIKDSNFQLSKTLIVIMLINLIQVEVKKNDQLGPKENTPMVNFVNLKKITNED